MRLQLSDPDLVDDLLRHLREGHDVVAARVGERELEVSILGSFRYTYARLELDRRLRAWRAAHPDLRVDCTD
jgi:hypothetical protein